MSVATKKEMETSRETARDADMDLRSDESFAPSIATTSSIMLIDEADMTPEQLKAYKEELAAVKSANRRVSLAGSIGGMLMEKRVPGFVEAYNNVRPLVIRLTAMSTVGAYRSFKLLAQLQRVLKHPYIPDLSKATSVTMKKKADALLLERAEKMCALACGAYPAETLIGYGINMAKDQTESTQTVFKKIMPKAEFIRRREIAESCVPAYILVADHATKQMIVVIQGSSETADWVTNLMCDPTGNDKGTHEGMRRAASNIDSEIRQEMLDYLKDHKNYNVYLTGHSLGAGVAALLTMRWLDEVPEQYRSRIRCMAFACPAVIPIDQTGKYDTNITSFVFGRDVVPRLSFGTMRDLLVMMQALSRYMKDTRAKGREVVVEEEAATRLNSASSIFTDGGPSIWEPTNEEVLGETRSALLEDETELQYLTNRRASLSSDSSFGRMLALDLNPEGLSEAEKKEQLEALALSLATTTLTLPLSFNQITTILKRRVAELDAALATLIPADDVVKPPGFLTRIAWAFFKFAVGGCRTTHDPVDLTVVEETRLLRACWDEIRSLKCQLGDRTLVAAGSCILMIPKVHFLEAEISPDVGYNAGQVVMYRLPKEVLVQISQEPVWTAAAMSEHTLPFYLQACAPKYLHKLPLRALPKQMRSNIKSNTAIKTHASKPKKQNHHTNTNASTDDKAVVQTPETDTTNTPLPTPNAPVIA